MIRGVALNVCTDHLLHSGDSWGALSLVLPSPHGAIGVGNVKALMPLQADLRDVSHQPWALAAVGASALLRDVSHKLGLASLAGTLL